MRSFIAGLFLLGCAAQASIITYTTTLNGSQEVPPTGSTATGFAGLTVNTVANTLSVYVTFSGLSSPDTAAHIHCCTTTPGSGATMVSVPFTGFPLGVTSGIYNSPAYDLTSTATYNSAFLTAYGGTASSAEAALLAGLAADEAYVNIHTNNFPGGEISGFATATPEPSSWALAGMALVTLLWRRRRT